MANKQTDPQQILFDTEDTAKLLGRSAWSIRQLYYQGELPAVRHGRKLYFHKDAIQEFVSRHLEARA